MIRHFLSLVLALTGLVLLSSTSSANYRSLRPIPSSGGHRSSVVPNAGRIYTPNLLPRNYSGAPSPHYSGNRQYQSALSTGGSTFNPNATMRQGGMINLYPGSGGRTTSDQKAIVGGASAANNPTAKTPPGGKTTTDPKKNQPKYYVGGGGAANNPTSQGGGGLFPGGSGGGGGPGAAPGVSGAGNNPIAQGGGGGLFPGGGGAGPSVSGFGSGGGGFGGGGSPQVSAFGGGTFPQASAFNGGTSPLTNGFSNGLSPPTGVFDNGGTPPGTFGGGTFPGSGTPPPEGGTVPGGPAPQQPFVANLARRNGAILGSVVDLQAPGSAGKSGTVGSALNSDRIARQTRRILHVRNNAGGPLRVWVQYYTQVEGGAYAWLPTNAKKVMAYDLEVGQEGTLQDGEYVVNGLCVRLWAEGAGRSWSRYRRENLWLVPESDSNNEHYYVAPQTEVYSFTINP